MSGQTSASRIAAGIWLALLIALAALAMLAGLAVIGLGIIMIAAA